MANRAMLYIGAPEKDEVYYNDALAYISEYRGRGGNPDYFISESWYFAYLSAYISETQKYTMTSFVKEIIHQVKEIE